MGRASAHEGLAAAHGRQRRRGRPRQRLTGAREDAPVEIAHGDVDVELRVQSLEAPGERGRIVEALGDQAGGVAGHPLAHVPHQHAPVDEREDETRRRADDEEHEQRVQIDAGVQPHRAGPGRTSA